MTHDPNGERISISREALRAELAEVKLELIDRFEKAVEQKADRSRVHDIANRVAALELVNAARLTWVDDIATIKSDVGSLKSWRIYSSGVVAGVMALIAYLHYAHIL